VPVLLRHVDLDAGVDSRAPASWIRRSRRCQPLHGLRSSCRSVRRSVVPSFLRSSSPNELTPCSECDPTLPNMDSGCPPHRCRDRSREPLLARAEKTMKNTSARLLKSAVSVRGSRGRRVSGTGMESPLTTFCRRRPTRRDQIASPLNYKAQRCWFVVCTRAQSLNGCEAVAPAAGWRGRRTSTVEEERRAQGGNGDQTVARVRDDGRDEAARDCKDGRKSRAREGDSPRVVQRTSTARRPQRWLGSRTSNGTHHRGQKEESADAVAKIDARTQHRLHRCHACAIHSRGVNSDRMEVCSAGAPD